MQDGRKTVRQFKRPMLGARSSTPTAARFSTRPTQSAQRNYERYLELARAETLAGNSVGAENYYQHAEHYYRSMYSGSN